MPQSATAILFQTNLLRSLAPSCSLAVVVSFHIPAAIKKETKTTSSLTRSGKASLDSCKSKETG